MMDLLELIRSPRRKAKRDLQKKFVPVIFANGVDEDLPGLIAAIRNEAVQYDEKTYRPGERLEIFGKPIVLSCEQLLILGPGQPLPADWPQPDPPRIVAVREANPPRPIRIQNCDFWMGGSRP